MHPRATLAKLERRSRLRGRLLRVRHGLWPATQTAAAAAISWWIALRVLSAQRPLFAPIVAVVALGFTTGRRGRTAVQVVVGVAVGIAAADLVARAIGAGGIQIAVVVLLAMVVGLLIGESPAFVNQAAISGLLVAAAYRPATGAPLDRLLQAVVGGGVALVFSQILFPVDPVERSRRAAVEVTHRLAAALTATAEAARDTTRTEEALAAAARLPDAVRQFDDAVDVAIGTARLAPVRRRQRAVVARVRAAREHLVFAAASTSSLARIVERGAGADVEPAAGAAAELARAAGEVLRGTGRDGREPLARLDEAIGGIPTDPVTAAAARLTLESLRAELAAAAGFTDDAGGRS